MATYAKLGFSKAKAIRTWSKAGIDPKIASDWEKEIPEKESIVIQFLKIGLTEPKEALKWMSIFSLPWDAAPWHGSGYSPEEAKELLAEGLQHPPVKEKPAEKAEEEE